MSKISDLPPIPDADVDGTETLPVVKNGASGRARVATLIEPYSAAAQAGVDRYANTLAEAIANFAVGDYFSCAESGSTRIYKRIAEAPFYEDMGDAAAPLTRGLMATAQGADKVGLKIFPTEYLQTVSDLAMGLPVSCLRFIDKEYHAGLFDKTFAYDVGPAFNTAQEAIRDARGTGHITVPAGAGLGFATTVIHLNGVSVGCENPAGRAVFAPVPYSNPRMWESENFADVTGIVTIVDGDYRCYDPILIEGGFSNILFWGDSARNPTGSGMFIAESGFTWHNVWFDDFGHEGYVRKGARTVGEGDGKNFTQLPYRRRVETILTGSFSVTRCGDSTHYGAIFGGPDDMEGHMLVCGGNNGKIDLACESQRYLQTHFYSNGQLVPDDYGLEISKAAKILGFELRDNYWGGARILSTAPGTKILMAQFQKNGRYTLADTQRHLLIEAADVEVHGEWQSKDDTLSGSTNGTMPAFEVASGAHRAIVKGKIFGNNSGSTRNMTTGGIIGDAFDCVVDIEAAHIAGPALKLNLTTNQQRRGDYRVRAQNVASVIEKNTTVQGGKLTIIDEGSNDALLTGSVAISALETWDVRSSAGSKSVANLYSADIAATAVASGDITIAHGLMAQPDYSKIDARVVRPSVGTLPDDVIVNLKIKNRDATNITVRWMVTTASGTAGSKFRVAIEARIGAEL